MTSERVSVVIPAWKAAGTIGQAIRSLLEQTRRPDEVIVVDDGSPDDIGAAVGQFGSFVRYFRKENGGVASARNFGLDVATGDFIAFLDADDYWHPQKLQRQMDVFAAHPEVGLVSCRYRVLRPDGSELICPALGAAGWDRLLQAIGPEAFAMAMLVWTSAVVFRRSVLGDERFEQSLRIAEDRDLWVRLIARTPIWLIQESLATLVAGEGSLSRSDLDADCRSMLTVIQRHSHLMDEEARRGWVASVYRRWAATHLGFGRARQALRPALRRLSYHPLSPEAWWVVGKSAVLAMAPRRIVAAGAKPYENELGGP